MMAGVGSGCRSGGVQIYLERDGLVNDECLVDQWELWWERGRSAGRARCFRMILRVYSLSSIVSSSLPSQ